MILGKLLSKRKAVDPDPDVLRAVESSGLFDPVWYIHRYPDVAAFPKGPLAHFCRYGLNELRDPSPDVSLSKYLNGTPRARTEPGAAILHTLAEMSVRERATVCLPDDDASLEYIVGRDQLFDEAWYRAQNQDLKLADGQAIRHFIDHGMYELRDPNAAFHAEYYRDRHPNYQACARTPFEHFVRIGRERGYAGRGTRERTEPEPGVLRLVEASGLFDPVWYVERYSDVASFRKGPLAHFCLHGFEEHRDPSPYVSLGNYFHRNPWDRKASLPAVFTKLGGLALPDRAAAGGSDDDRSLEYLTRQHDLFDVRWYLARNPDVAHSGLKPIRHFIRYGMYELRDPGPAFDGEFYRDQHPDYGDRSRTPFEDYVKVGRRMGYAAIGLPKYQRWLAAFDALTPSDLDRIRAEGARESTRAVACHVLDAGACERIEPILAMWRDQVGVACEVRFVRGADVPEGAWDRCAALVRSGRDASVAEPRTALDDLAEDTVVLLCGGTAVVRPHAAYVFSNILARGLADAAYADHDHLDEAGVRTGPVFKPIMSPEFMRRVSYAGPVVGTVLRGRFRAGLAAAIAAAAEGDAEDAWASFLLNLPRERVRRTPFVLFHRLGRAAPTATFEPTPKPRLTAAGREPAERITFDGRTAPGGTVSGASTQVTRVTIVIPTRDRGELLRECIDSLTSETDYPLGCMEIVVVDNGSEEEATLAYFAELRARADVTVVPSPGPFNFSQICNDGAARATGDVIVFLNNDVTVNKRDWLSTLVRHAIEPDVGVVGARLLYPDGSVQHGGVVLGLQGVGGHRLLGMDADLVDRIDVTREMPAVTGACLAIRRALFQALGGFDPVLQVAFNDVKLCVDAFEAGYRGLYVAEPLLVHHESKSRGLDDTALKQRRNAREAIYVRERHASLFRDDPSYSPNLSLTRIGDLATPRVVRPWRRSVAGRRRVLLLSRVLNQGSGVAVVVRQQAMFLRARGWEVTVGGPIGPRDLAFEGCRRVDVRTPETAAAHAVEHGLDCVIAHTPPFFSITRHLGAQPLAFFMDHGEPTPHLFPDRDHREGVEWEKRFCAPLARRVFVISRTVFRHQHRDDAIVLRNGNAHMAAWSPAWAERRPALRAKFGLEGRFTVLNVCRFGPGERLYKGVGRYGEVASDLPYRHPHLAGRVRFVLAGRGDEDDVATARAMGLTVFADPSDAEMAELYAASDLYLNLSEWEGYNLGIGQALAMGLDVVASDIEAHREFDVELLTGIPEICAAVARRHARWDEDANGREPTVEGWDGPLTRLAETIERDVDAVVPQWSWTGDPGLVRP